VKHGLLTVAVAVGSIGGALAVAAAPPPLDARKPLSRKPSCRIDRPIAPPAALLAATRRRSSAGAATAPVARRTRTGACA
jgi:hypothetical protein